MRRSKRTFGVIITLMLFLPTISPDLCFSQRITDAGVYDTKQALYPEALPSTNLTSRNAAESLMLAETTKAAITDAGSEAGTKVQHKFQAGNLEWFAFLAVIVVGVVMTVTGGIKTTSNH